MGEARPSRPVVQRPRRALAGHLFRRRLGEQEIGRCHARFDAWQRPTSGQTRVSHNKHDIVAQAEPGRQPAFPFDPAGGFLVVKLDIQEHIPPSVENESQSCPVRGWQ